MKRVGNLIAVVAVLAGGVFDAAAEVDLHATCTEFRELGAALGTWIEDPGNLMVMAGQLAERRTAREFLYEQFGREFDLTFRPMGILQGRQREVEFLRYATERVNNASAHAVELPLYRRALISAAAPYYSSERAGLAAVKIVQQSTPNALARMRRLFCGEGLSESQLEQLGQCLADGLPASVVHHFPGLWRGRLFRPHLNELGQVLNYLRYDRVLAGTWTRYGQNRDAILAELTRDWSRQNAHYCSSDGGSGPGATRSSGVVARVTSGAEQPSTPLPILAQGRSVGRTVEGVPNVAVAPSGAQVVGSVLAATAVGRVLGPLVAPAASTSVPVLVPVP